MFIKSIRWRLQIWYGLMLVIVLTGFGFTAYQLERGRLFRLVDEQLERRATALASVLHPPRRRPPQPGESPLDREPPLPRSWPDAPPTPFDHNGTDAFPRPPVDFRLPMWTTSLFDETDSNGFYYVIFALDGTELARSTNAPRQVIPSPLPRFRMTGTIRENQPPPLPPPEPPRPQNRASYREITIGAVPGHVMLVGRSMTSELVELRRFAWWLSVVGAVVLLLGLAGGWWLASRALRPIEEISAAAVKISVGDLSHRINTAGTDSELGRLASVLNSTFARLETAFGQQKQFTSDAAHELRTPVAVILTQTQTALSRERGAVEYRETIEACQRSAQRMRRLIESLLELARLEAGQETIRRLRFDLSPVIRDCLTFVGPLAQERAVKILGEIPAVECVGDSDLIAQVITNLLTNAIEYNKPDGEVRLSLNSQNGTAILTVSDTGQGISEADLPHLFKRFFRADPSRSGSAGHSGLGLAIAKAIVEAHGGTIEVSSRPGLGSTFSIRLPG